MWSASPDSQPFDDDSGQPAPMTAQQAAQFRRANPVLSPWRVIRVQAVVGMALTALAWIVWGSQVAVSVACGAGAVVIPAILFARGLSSPIAQANPGAAVVSFMVWELVKITVAVAIMFAAYRWVSEINGLAMLAGLILTMKVYWLALVFKPGRAL